MGKGEAGFISKLCLVWKVDYPWFIFHLDNGLSMQVLFWVVGVKVKSYQVPDMFPKEFPITPHFYPICFGKCCPPFTYIGWV
jgi:hypothetical protein